MFRRFPSIPNVACLTIIEAPWLLSKICRIAVPAATPRTVGTSCSTLLVLSCILFNLRLNEIDGTRFFCACLRNSIYWKVFKMSSDRKLHQLESRKKRRRILGVPSRKYLMKPLVRRTTTTCFRPHSQSRHTYLYNLLDGKQIVAAYLLTTWDTCWSTTVLSAWYSLSMALLSRRICTFCCFRVRVKVPSPGVDIWLSLSLVRVIFIFDKRHWSRL